MDLKPRHTPTQKRAELTVNKILDSSADLLEEVGLDNFNTNLLAERADIRVSTVYRYFPNKLAILSALLKRWLGLVVESMACTTKLAEPEEDWRGIFDMVIDNYVNIAVTQKGHLSIRRAVLAAPELVQLEAKWIRQLTDRLVDALERRGIQQSRRQLSNIMEVFMTTTAQAVDLAIIKEKKHKGALVEIINELKLLQKSYLANYFG